MLIFHRVILIFDRGYSVFHRAILIFDGGSLF
jgi:hypothetical protein